MRVVLDTNVVISAVVYGGNPREMLQAAISKRIDLSISDELVQEFQGVLQRRQFGLNTQFVQNVIAELAVIAEWVVPQIHHELIKDDPTDNLILDCAIAAEADYIVTGDNHLLKLGRFGNVRITSPQKFIEILRQQKGLNSTQDE